MTPTPRRRCARLLLALTLTLAGFVVSAGIASAAPRSASPVLSATSDTGPASEGTAVNVHLAAAGLDPSRPASLYKGRWSTNPQFTGWEYLYYRGVSVSANGTFATDEVNSEAGTFRYQICQYYEGQRKNYWVCSNYAELTL